MIKHIEYPTILVNKVKELSPSEHIDIVELQDEEDA